MAISILFPYPRTVTRHLPFGKGFDLRAFACKIHSTSRVEIRNSNHFEIRTSNVELRTSTFELRASNFRSRTSLLPTRFPYQPEHHYFPPVSQDGESEAASNAESADSNDDLGILDGFTRGS